MPQPPQRAPRRSKPGDRFFRVSRPIQWRVILPTITQRRAGSGISTTVIAYGFIAIILIGTALLMLPFSTTTGEVPHFTTALFTASSAVSVTGHVVVDTADYWSPFGEAVILLLIQVGGFGFMTTATLVLLALGRRIGLRERLLIREAMGVTQLGGVVRITRQIALFTITAEALGAVLLYSRMSTEFTVGKALWNSVFLSVSAFNNSGFDIMGGFRSLRAYQTDPLVILTVTGLIVLGGISFMVVSDFLRHPKFKHLSLDSKIVITAAGALLLLGTVVFLVGEYTNPETMGALSPANRILNSFFLSATSRTAGFSSISVSNLAVYSVFFTMFLMFVGGAAGSTAGGIKMNTFGLLLATLFSSLRGHENATAFEREIHQDQINRALTLVMLAAALISVVVFSLTITETFPFIQLLFETISAFGTVGLSTGITPSLSIAGRLIIIATMVVGRIGPLTLILSLTLRQHGSEYRYPKASVRIG